MRNLTQKRVCLGGFRIGCRPLTKQCCSEIEFRHIIVVVLIYSLAVGDFGCSIVFFTESLIAFYGKVQLLSIVCLDMYEYRISRSGLGAA